MVLGSRPCKDTPGQGKVYMNKLFDVLRFIQWHTWCKWFHLSPIAVTGGDGKKYEVCGGNGKGFPDGCYLYRPSSKFIGV